jgi:hypothetical protein
LRGEALLFCAHCAEPCIGVGEPSLELLARLGCLFQARQCRCPIGADVRQLRLSRVERGLQFLLRVHCRLQRCLRGVQLGYQPPVSRFRFAQQSLETTPFGRHLVDLRFRVDEPRLELPSVYSFLVQLRQRGRAPRDGLGQLALSRVQGSLQLLLRPDRGQRLVQLDRELLAPHLGVAQVCLEPAPLGGRLIHLRQRRGTFGDDLRQLRLTRLERRLQLQRRLVRTPAQLQLDRQLVSPGRGITQLAFESEPLRRGVLQLRKGRRAVGDNLRQLLLTRLERRLQILFRVR